MKTFGVIVLSYNFQKYIAECLTSIISQTKPIDQVVCVDDYSNDETLSIIKSKINGRKNYSCINNKFKKSKYNSINQYNCIKTGLELIKTDYVFLIDGDDFWKENKVETYHNNIDLGTDLCFDGISLKKYQSEFFDNEFLLSHYINIDLSHKILKKIGLLLFATPQTSALCFSYNQLKHSISKFSTSHYEIWPDVQFARLIFFEKPQQTQCLKHFLTVRRIHSKSDSLGFTNDNTRWKRWKSQAEDFFDFKHPISKLKLIRLFFYLIPHPKALLEYLKWIYVKFFIKRR